MRKKALQIMNAVGTEQDLLSKIEARRKALKETIASIQAHGATSRTPDRVKKFVGIKFQMPVDGRLRVVYFYDQNIVKVDGEHTYLWLRDERLDWNKVKLLLNS